MSATELSTWIDVTPLPTGRLLFALKVGAENAKEKKLKEALAVINETSRVAKVCFELEEEWARAKVSNGAGDTLREADNTLDAMIGGLHQTLQQMTKLYRNDARQRETVAAMLLSLFPGGATDITGADYATELEKTNALLGTLREDWKTEVRAFHLTPWVSSIADAAATLSRLHLQFKKKARVKLEWSQVTAAQRQRNESMRQFIVFVLGRWRTSEKPDVVARDALLGPVFDQIETVRADYRRSRGPSDTTPDGEPRVPPAAPPQ